MRRKDVGNCNQTHYVARFLRIESSLSFWVSLDHRTKWGAKTSRREGGSMRSSTFSNSQWPVSVQRFISLFGRLSHPLLEVRIIYLDHSPKIKWANVNLACLVNTGAGMTWSIFVQVHINVVAYFCAPFSCFHIIANGSSLWTRSCPQCIFCRILNRFYSKPHLQLLSSVWK